MQSAEPDAGGPGRRRLSPAKEERARLRRQALVMVLEKCHKALELLEAANIGPDVVEPSPDRGADDQKADGGEFPRAEAAADASSLQFRSPLEAETDELCALLKSKVESPSFLEKLGSKDVSVSQNFHDEIFSWNIVNATDLCEDGHVQGDIDPDNEDYVFVRHEDIAEGIACFMATYLLSLKQTKEISPVQLQEALGKAFSGKKNSRLRKAWEGSKIIYNVASWGATAIGIYQNPVILKAASLAFWSSCNIISRLL